MAVHRDCSQLGQSRTARGEKSAFLCSDHARYINCTTCQLLHILVCNFMHFQRHDLVKKLLAFFYLSLQIQNTFVVIVVKS